MVTIGRLVGRRAIDRAFRAVPNTGAPVFCSACVADNFMDFIGRR